MYSQKRRRIYAQSPRINHLAVFEFHNWICVICGSSIDKNIRFPDENAATLEHIVPLSRGGKHEWSNVAPAHAKCNYDKDDKMMEEYKCQ